MAHVQPSHAKVATKQHGKGEQVVAPAEHHLKASDDDERRKPK
jgi:hypothetical protein